MPDTVLYSQGVGTAIATDEVSGVQYQVIKWDIGAPDTSIPLSGSAAFGIPVFTNKGVTLVGPVGVSGSVSLLALPGVSIIGPAAVSGIVSIGATVGIPIIGPVGVSGSVTILALPGVSIIGPAAVSGTITALGPSASGAVFTDGLFPMGVLGNDGRVWSAKGNSAAPFVQGPTASGIAFTGNPNVFAGVDAAGLVHSLRADMGRLFVQGSVTSGQVFGTGNPLVMGALDKQANANSLLVESSANPNLRTGIWSTTVGPALVGSPADTLANANNYLAVFNLNENFNNTNWDRQRNVNGASGGVGLGLLGVSNLVQGSDGIYWPARIANAASGTVGTGLPGVGPLLWDAANSVWRNALGDIAGRHIITGPSADGVVVPGTPVLVGGGTSTAGLGNAQSARCSSATSDAASSSPGIWTVNQNMINNIAGTWDRMRSANAASGLTGTGLPGVNALVQGADGIYWPIRAANAASGTTSTGLLGIGNLVQGSDGIWWTARGNSLAPFVQGSIAHAAADSGNPVKTGAVAVAHGVSPTAVAAAQRTNLYANRHGIPFAIGGHPNVQTVRANYTGAQTNTSVVVCPTGCVIVVTRVMVTASHANTVDVSVVIGFGTTTTPTTTSVVAAHPNIDPGGGFATGDGSGILGVGASDQDLRITSSVPTTGSIDVVVSYYTIES